MVDAVDTEILSPFPREYTVRFTNISDGTGESAVTKIDRSGLIGPNGEAPGKILIKEIQYDVQGFEGIRVYWQDGASGETAVVLAGQGIREYNRYGGIVPDTAGAVANGDILFSVNGTAAAGDTYDITLTCRLKV